MNICILGRQPLIGCAELEAVYGAEKVKLITDNVAMVGGTIKHPEYLGGTIKVATQLATVPSTNWRKVADTSAKLLPGLVANMEGKIKLGVSSYGLPVTPRDLTAIGLRLKTELKKHDRSSRVIPNKDPALSSAHVLHNHLTGDRGVEFVFVRDGDQTIIARTTHEQDIEAYAKRDHGRPMRDAYVGMLPPKLAQTMINLASAATGAAEVSETSAFPAGAKQDINNHMALSGVDETSDDSAASQKRLLDPFCGTGVVLQEAALMGMSVYGTDVSEKMIRYTRDNLVWLEDTHDVKPDKYFHEADATDTTWQQPIDLVVCEGFLGRPISHMPLRETLDQIMHESNAIMKDFLKNIAPQLKSGTPLCVAVPAWHVNGQVIHLAMLDKIEAYGYERVSFTHATNDNLLYYREDQIVARELLVLKRI